MLVDKEDIGPSRLLKRTVRCFGKDKQFYLLTPIQGLPQRMVYKVCRTTGDPAWSVQSQRFCRWSWNSEHLLGIRRDFYRANPDTNV